MGLDLRWEWNGPRTWLGLSCKRQGERVIVSSVRSDGPAYAAGVYAHDEILALDGWRVDDERLNERLDEREPGDTVRLTLFRGDRLVEVPITLAEAPCERAIITPVETPTEAQRRAYHAWLGTAPC